MSIRMRKRLPGRIRWAVNSTSSSALTILPQTSSADEDDFEVVPQEPDGDLEMWDVENENEDEARQAKIKSAIFHNLFAIHF